jgi:predicted nuclease of predicted toxin-antitoxin system
VKRFLVDAQLPPALARWLAAAGREAEHVADVGLGDASDHTIWDYALAAGEVIISKDEDFSQRKALGDEGPAMCGSGFEIPAVACLLLRAGEGSRPIGY